MGANLQFAWWWFLAGIVSGVVLGLGFHRDDWLGGYGSWRRRLTRLGHVAFFGTGLLNLAFAATAAGLAATADPAALRAASVLLLLGAAAMPPACFAAAWRRSLRPVFAVPVLALAAGIAITAVLTLQSGAE
jgi:hypothetical protein